MKAKTILIPKRSGGPGSIPAAPSPSELRERSWREAAEMRARGLSEEDAQLFLRLRKALVH